MLPTCPPCVRAEKAGRGCWGWEREVHKGSSWSDPPRCMQLAGVKLGDCSPMVHPASTDNPTAEAGDRAEPGGKRVSRGRRVVSDPLPIWLQGWLCICCLTLGLGRGGQSQEQLWPEQGPRSTLFQGTCDTLSRGGTTTSRRQCLPTLHVS